jgi:N-acetylglutamate synthase-like GNAT family acetyltransferase
MNVTIRKATDADFSQIKAIQEELKRPTRQLLNASHFLVAETDRLLVGCAATSSHGDSAYFYGLAVRKAWQRQGLGGQLMEARLAGLGTGIQYAIALVMFWNSRFFRKFLFAPIKRTEIPPSAQVHSDLTDPAFRRSAVMLRRV